MKIYNSPAARRPSRLALSALFTLALLAAGLAPPDSRVEAKSRPKAKRRARAEAANAGRGAKSLRVARRAEKAEAVAHAGLDEPTAGGESADEVEQREGWLRFQRSYPFDTPPAAARRQAWASRPRGRLKDGDGPSVLSAAASQWTPLGPTPTSPELEANWGKTSGRVNAIAVKPDAPNVIVIGAATGGIWRSTDGGNNFAPVSDNQVDLSVGSIAFAPSSPNFVYAGMGDLWGGYFGSGILKSNDGGATWQRVSDASLPPYGLINNVRVDPNDPNRVYVTLYQYYDGNPDGAFGIGGFYYSTDGGVSWNHPLVGLVRDLAINPANPQILYAGMRRVDSNVDGSNLPGLYRSNNGGLTWARVYASTFGAYTATTRIDMRVAVTPSAPRRVYVFSGNTVATTSPLVLAVSEDEGQSWATRPTNGIDPGQLFYNVYMFVDPADAQTIYVATRDVFKSTNDGASWQSLTKNFVKSGASWDYFPDPNPTYPSGSASHPDQHSFAFSPGDSSTFYIGNDGGVSKTTDGGASFRSLNASLTLSQFVGIAAHPTDPNFTVGGTQDNGTLVRRPGGGWSEFAGGDGGHPLVNPVDPRGVISTYIRGSISRWQFNANGTISPRGGTSESTFSEPFTSPRIAFYPPLVSNGVDSAAYFGTWRLFVNPTFLNTVSGSAAAWSAPGGASDQTRGGTVNCAVSPKPPECSDVLSAIGVARAPYSGSQVIYTGSAQGRVMLTQNGGATWADVTPGLPDRSITGITVDPANAGVAYVTLGGYGTGHVWKTTNFGQSWADLSGTNATTKLPNVFTSAVLVDPANPNLIYAATDIGVFRSAGDGNWETLNAGMPPVPVSGFSVGASGKVQIATYGRGAYELQTAAPAAVSSLQFELQIASVGEATPRATLNVTRTGDTSTTVSATVRTQDNPAAVRCDDTTTQPFVAFARCDYATTVETLTFAPGETTKSFPVSIINDVFKEPDENVVINLVNPSAGAQIGAGGTMTLRIVSDDAETPPAGANPILQTDFFVRQQYLDFFGREPDPAGFAAWKATLDNCPDPFNSSPTSASANCDRVSVSTKFFRSQEFELKGRFVFNFYKVAFARLPRYSEIIPDMASLTAVDNAGFFAKKAQFTNEFVQRQEFRNLYDGLTNTQFVDTLMGRYGVQQITTPDPATPDDTANKITLTRADLINRLNSGALTRAQVVRALAGSNEVSAAEANSAFVAMQYFGYLRRDPETQGFNDWLNHLTVTHPGDFRSMVNGFMNSVEYRLRFGTP